MARFACAVKRFLDPGLIGLEEFDGGKAAREHEAGRQRVIISDWMSGWVVTGPAATGVPHKEIERMRIVRCVAPAAIILGLASALTVIHAAEFDESRRVVIAAMRRVFRGPDALIEKATAGEASEPEKQKLLKVLTDMAAVPAARGDAASWKGRTEALVAAAQDLVDGKEGARDRLRAASACKACHQAHQPKAD
jgi:hypothetical protein